MLLRNGSLEFYRITFLYCLIVMMSLGANGAFKFVTMWLKFEGFVKKVKQLWLSYSFQGSLSFVLAQQLKHLKLGLTKRNKEVFGNVEKQKKALLIELHGIHVIAEGRPLMDKEKTRKTENTGTLLEEISWRHKSRDLWLRGDMNIKFFHQVANSHIRNNTVDSLVINNVVFSDAIEISEYILQYYTSLLRTI
jgi:hypothetical protein